ncbi:hypothetical protein BS47DRAFT_854466 [Hydnum rufescens UP504]|uniref:Uncharacterized protein n=1 Tax=Hydnum rufescens UP504 TaxID=1448309 RepID=A0A9P6AZG5_9AGAM|nr:hypothetical protein BS47DRAFT_854466 [Hydnum rufescens UP504]
MGNYPTFQEELWFLWEWDRITGFVLNLRGLYHFSDFSAFVVVSVEACYGTVSSPRAGRILYSRLRIRRLVALTLLSLATTRLPCREMGSQNHSKPLGLFKRLSKFLPNPSRLFKLFSNRSPEQDSSSTKRSPNPAQTPPIVRASEELALVPRPQSPDYPQSQFLDDPGSHTDSATPPHPVITPIQEYPMGRLKIKTGGGGSARGTLAIGGDAGGIGSTDERPRIDLAKSGITKAAIGGRGGNIGGLGALIDMQRGFYDVDIDTGLGGTATSTETVEDPDDDDDDDDDGDRSLALTTHGISGP